MVDIQELPLKLCQWEKATSVQTSLSQSAAGAWSYKISSGTSNKIVVATHMSKCVQFRSFDEKIGGYGRPF